VKVGKDVMELVVRGCICAGMSCALFAMAIWGYQ
jgi:hypothetical protein